MFRAIVIFILATVFSMPSVAKTAAKEAAKVAAKEAANDAAKEKDTTLPSNTIDCKQFKKTGPREWAEVGTAVFDLGDVQDINLTDQPVTPGYFRFGGVELFGVLEAKCGAPGFLTQGRKDQAKGDYDNAIAAFNQAIALDPKLAEAYQDRAGAYESKGDYARAIADYGEALKLDPKLESAAAKRLIAQQKLAQASDPNAPAEPQLTLQEAGAALKKGLEPAPQEQKAAEVADKPAEVAEKPADVSEKPAEVPEKAAETSDKAEQEPGASASEDKTASLKSQSESGSCSAGKLVYAADGASDAEGGAPVIEIVLEGGHEADSKDASNSEFIIRQSRNNEVQWTYKGTYIQKDKSGRFEFTSQEARRRRPAAVLPANYIKPNRDGTGKAILYLGGLQALFNDRALKVEGKRSAAVLPEVFYFDRCE